MSNLRVLQNHPMGWRIANQTSFNFQLYNTLVLVLLTYLREHFERLRFALSDRLR